MNQGFAAKPRDKIPAVAGLRAPGAVPSLSLVGKMSQSLQVNLIKSNKYGLDPPLFTICLPGALLPSVPKFTTERCSIATVCRKGGAAPSFNKAHRAKRIRRRAARWLSGLRARTPNFSAFALPQTLRRPRRHTDPSRGTRLSGSHQLELPNPASHLHKRRRAAG